MSVKDTYTSALDQTIATILAGTSLSSGINLGGLRLFGIIVPSNWTAASITFLMSADGGLTWIPMKDQSGNPITASNGAGSYVSLDPTVFAPIQFIKVCSGTPTVPVVQTADRAVTLVLRSV